MSDEKTSEFPHYREIMPHHLERLRDPAHVAKITSPSFKQWFGDWEGGSDHSKVIHPLTAHPGEVMQIEGTKIPVSRDKPGLVPGQPGAPRPVFHGTTLGGYDRYSTQYMNPKNLMGPGFYHTEDPEMANTYTKAVNVVAGVQARPQVQMGYMDMRNPFDADHGLRLQLARANDSMRPMIDPQLPAWKKLALWFSALRDKEFVSQAGRFRIPFGVPGVPLPPAFNPREDHPQETFGEIAAKFNAKAGRAPEDPYGKQAAHEHLQKLGFDGITHTGGIYLTPMGQSATAGRIHRVWIGFRPNQFKHVDNTGAFNPQDDRFHYGHDGLGISELVQRMRELGLAHGGRELAARLVEFLNRNPQMRASVSLADLSLIHAWGTGMVRYEADPSPEPRHSRRETEPTPPDIHPVFKVAVHKPTPRSNVEIARLYLDGITPGKRGWTWTPNYELPGFVDGSKINDVNKRLYDAGHSALLNHYTRHSRPINAYLRGPENWDFKRARAPREFYEGMRSGIDDAFAKYPAFQTPVELHRALFFQRFGLGRLQDSFMEKMFRAHDSGDLVQWPGYTSASTRPGAYYTNSDPDVKMHILTHHGIDVRPFSHYPDEMEVLLNHNSHFKVLGYNGPGGDGGKDKSHHFYVQQFHDPEKIHYEATAPMNQPIILDELGQIPFPYPLEYMIERLGKQSDRKEEAQDLLDTLDEHPGLASTEQVALLRSWASQ